MSSSKKTWPPIMSKLACPLKIPKRFMFKKLMETSNSHIQAMEMWFHNIDEIFQDHKWEVLNSLELEQFIKSHHGTGSFNWSKHNSDNSSQHTCVSAMYVCAMHMANHLLESPESEKLQLRDGYPSQIWHTWTIPFFSCEQHMAKSLSQSDSQLGTNGRNQTCIHNTCVF